MDKPQMKRKVGIRIVLEESLTITFNCSIELADEFSSFGKIERDIDKSTTHMLLVDSRYDFDEVLKYIKSYE